MPVAPQTPAIDNVPYEIDRLSFMITEKVQKQFGLCGFGTQMYIRNKQSPEFSVLWSVGAHLVVPFDGNLI